MILNGHIGLKSVVVHQRRHASHLFEENLAREDVWQLEGDRVRWPCHVGGALGHRGSSRQGCVGVDVAVHAEQPVLQQLLAALDGQLALLAEHTELDDPEALDGHLREVDGTVGVGVGYRDGAGVGCCAGRIRRGA